MQLPEAIAWMFIISLPVACVSWTFTHEELFRELHIYFVRRSQSASVLKRKFFFLFTCEYCFSHYITILFLALTRFKLLLPGWKGYVIAGFAIVWIANTYMSLYALLRQNIKKEKTEIKQLEKRTESSDPF